MNVPERDVRQRVLVILAVAPANVGVASHEPDLLVLLHDLLLDPTQAHRRDGVAHVDIVECAEPLRDEGAVRLPSPLWRVRRRSVPVPRVLDHLPDVADVLG